MDVKQNQTNPYSSQPKPPSPPGVGIANDSNPQPQAAAPTPPPPAPTPAPQPEPAPSPVAQAPAPAPAPEPAPQPMPVNPAPAQQMPQQPQPQPNQMNQPMAAANPAKKKSKKMIFIIIGSVIGMFLIAIVIGVIIYSTQQDNSSLSDEVSALKQENSNLKGTLVSNGISSDNPLLGGGADEDGEVAGAQTYNPDLSGLYVGQVGLNGDKIVFEVYVQKDTLGKLDAMWIDIGRSVQDLSSTAELKKGINKDVDKDRRVLIEVDRDAAEAGNVYFYRAGARSVDGTEASSSVGVFSMPGAQDTSQDNQQNQNQNQSNNNPSNNPATNTPPDLADILGSGTNPQP